MNFNIDGGNLFWILAAILPLMSCGGVLMAAGPDVPSGRKLGSILNADNHSTNLWVCSGLETTREEAASAAAALVSAGPGVLALRVGSPDPVYFRSRVGTTIDKHLEQVALAAHGEEVLENQRPTAQTMRRLLELGTDPLELAVEACRERGVLIVGSFRMNDAHFGDHRAELADFWRDNPQWRIAGTTVVDPAIPQVYEHRMALFREVLENYDIDGIEFDFMRWQHMISEPRRNHTVLTKMVAETRSMLDDVARRKGRRKLLLGVRVPPSLQTRPDVAQYPGMAHPEMNHSCLDKGLNVKTWIDHGDVDYVCPSLSWPLWPGLPHTKEFVDLAGGTEVGIYPTLFPVPTWVHGANTTPIERDDHERLLRYKNELCRLALQLYDDGADGISTYNWIPHAQRGLVPDPPRLRTNWGDGAKQVQLVIHAKLDNREQLEAYLQQKDLEAILGVDPG